MLARNFELCPRPQDRAISQTVFYMVNLNDFPENLEQSLGFQEANAGLKCRRILGARGRGWGRTVIRPQQTCQPSPHEQTRLRSGGRRRAASWCPRYWVNF